jgi:HPt (histidine-containing phosphotransfer) domain-containing protein
VNALFRAIHSIKGNAGVLLGQVLETKMAENHPLSQLSCIAHALESLLEPLREPKGGPVPPSAVATVLDARDALQALLDNVASHSRTFVIPSALLQQLGLGEAAKPDDAAESAGAAAFRNTAKQCLDVLDSCLHQLEQGQSAESVLKTYKRSLKTLASAAAYQKRSDLDEPIAIQLQILRVRS